MLEELSPFGEWLLAAWCSFFHKKHLRLLNTTGDAHTDYQELWCQKCKRLRYVELQ